MARVKYGVSIPFTALCVSTVSRLPAIKSVWVMLDEKVPSVLNVMVPPTPLDDPFFFTVKLTALPVGFVTAHPP
jgi:hypothetical protein